MIVPSFRRLCTPGSALLLGALLVWGCSSEGEGRPDKDLGDLVISPSTEFPTVDLEKVSQGHQPLLDAVALPHAWVSESLGAHKVEGKSTVQVKEGDTIIEELEDTLLIDIDGENHFVATLDNSKDYGRHAIFDGESLYLRPRFGKYHGRAPQSDDEASEIRNQIFAGASDYLALFSSQLEVSDKGSQTLGGRAVRQVALKLAPKAHKKSKPPEHSQSLWRASIEVQAIEGLISFDAETGVPLSLEFQGSIKYTRDKRRFEMILQASRSISDIAHQRAIAAPAADMVLRIPARQQELAERDQILQGIAPPARKAPLPTPAATDEPAANAAPTRGE
jgi:hypothetical protein